MPFLKPIKKKPIQWQKWEEKTNMEGYRAAVFGSSKQEKYTGWYRSNAKHGKGFQSYADEFGFLTFYEGDWENDKRHGNGSLSFDCDVTKKTLRIYSGEWKNDKMSGAGMKSFPDGGLYKGDFKNGMRHGKGIMYYQDGSIYTGEWHRDKRHGVGRLMKNGNYYEGSFNNDIKCGLGRFHHVSTGSIQEGVWQDGLPQITVLMDDPDPDNRIDPKTGKPKTLFSIPQLTILKNPKQVYLKRAHEVLDEIEEIEIRKAQEKTKDQSRVECNMEQPKFKSSSA